MSVIKIKQDNEFVDIPTLAGPQGEQGIQGPTGVGIPAGGGTGNIIVKNSTTDYDTIWKAMVDVVYPVGSIYMSINSTNPGTLFGGTWEQIKDRFMLAAGDVYTGGATGGSNTHKHEKGTLYACIDPRNIYGNTLYKIKEQGWTISHYSLNGREVVANTSGAGNAVDIEGETSETTVLPPYLAVYIWKRTN